MGPRALNSGRLDLRPERCPPIKQPQFQDPGYTPNKVLFLGLFDVTRRLAVAGVTLYPMFYCFDTVLTLFGPDDTLWLLGTEVITGPKFSKTGTKFSKTVHFQETSLGNLIETHVY